MNDNIRGRSGLRIKAFRAHPEVRRAVVRFARWARTEMDFPIRVPVYLSPSEWILTADKKRVSASFFAPFKRTAEPFIRVSTGDYLASVKKSGRDNALAAILCSVAHEITHYQQWIHGGKFCEREAIRKASKMIRAYAKTTSHP